MKKRKLHLVEHANHNFSPVSLCVFVLISTQNYELAQNYYDSSESSHFHNIIFVCVINCLAFVLVIIFTKIENRQNKKEQA